MGMDSAKLVGTIPYVAGRKSHMRRSETVGITEVQAMLRLVAETAELWYDPMVQRRYTLESLCKLLPAKAGICFTFGDILMGGEEACGQLEQAGLDDSQQRLVKTYLQSGDPADPALPKLAEITAPVVVARRIEPEAPNCPWGETQNCCGICVKAAARTASSLRA